MIKLLAIIALVVAGCTTTPAATPMRADGGTTPADTQGGAGGGPTGIAALGSGGDMGAAGLADTGGDGDGDGDAETLFSVSDPGVLEGDWEMTRQLREYECDGVTLRVANPVYPLVYDPQISDYRIDAENHLYKGEDLKWDPGTFDADIWYPDASPSRVNGWSNPVEITAIDADTLTGRARYEEGGCSGEDHFTIEMTRSGSP